MTRRLYLAVASVALATAAHAVTLDDGRRVRVSGYLDGLGIVSTGDGPRQRPQAIGVLRVDGDVTPRLRTHVELRSWFGGPPQGGQADVYSLIHTFQDVSPALEFREAYAHVRLDAADVRMGIQTVAWGKLDGAPPTDVVDPRDFHDPFVIDAEDAKIGVPALQGTYYPPDVPRLGLGQLHAGLVWVPLTMPSRLPLVDERWFPQSAIPAPDGLTIPHADAEELLERSILRQCRRGQLTGAVCNDVDVDVPQNVPVHTTIGTANHRAPLTVGNGGVGVRLGGAWHDVDWDLYHWTGPETGPNASLETTIVGRDVMFPEPPSTTVPIGPLSAQSLIRQKNSRIHMTGVDWSTAVGDATVRGEAAFFQNHPYLRIASDLVSPAALRRLRLPGGFVDQAVKNKGCTKQKPCSGAVALGALFPERNAVEWGVGADYVTHGVFTLLQLNQIVLTEDAPRLVIDDPETRFTALVRRQLLHERLELEVRGLYELGRGGWALFPRVSYRVVDGLRLRIGYLAIGGSRNSLLGQFGRNDEVVFQARYSF